RNVNKFVTLDVEDRVIRVKGLDPDKNRYGTAAEIARLYPDGVQTVYVTTGETYYDALAAAPSASQGFAPTKGGEQTTADGEVQNTPTGDPAPILLVESDAAVPDITQTVLDEIGPTNIIILGGTGAVSQDVEDQLIAENEGEVTRIGGADRYVTAALLAQDYGSSDKVFVATGETDGFGDALSGSALAGSEGVPVLLTKKDVAPGVVERTIEELGATEIVFLGGENAISDDVYQQLGGTDRIFGADRYRTSAAIVDEFGYGEGNPAPFAHVATGENFADALTGSALASFQDAPVVLTRQSAVPAGVLNALKGIDPEQLYVLGGPVAVSEAAEAQLDAAFPADEGGPTFEGVGVGEAVGPAPLVYAGDAASPGVSEQAARECWLTNGGLDPAVVEGNIVICDRGTVARVDKSAAVAEAGGIGMILANTAPGQSLNADFHSLPSIHVDSVAGGAIKAYEASDASPTAFISADGQGEVTAPEMAGFSSFGPALAGGGDLLKPDITAPGVDVIAAVAPPGNGGEDFFAYSGTSMSSPHIAGLALLMAQDNPDWSPAAIKSAMMTTASPLNNMGEPIERGGEDADAFDYGSGEVEPGPAYGPGLVYDAGFSDWFEYGCAIGQFQFITAPGTCDAFTADASDLNSPSIAVGSLAGRQTVTRTVTNVGTSTVFTPQVEAPPGVTAVVTPATLTVAPGATATYEVLLTRTTAPLDEYTFGSLTWVGDAGHEVRSPIAVRPVGIAAPEEISGEGVSGNQDVTVTPGFTGTLSTDVDGLVASDVEVVMPVSDGPGGGASILDGVRAFTVPDGVDVLRVSIFDSEISVPDTDMDIYLVNSNNQIVASSAAGGSDESFTVEDPAPGAYRLAVDYWNGDTGETADVPTHLFLVTEADAGNLTVTPPSSSVTVGEDTTLNFAWDGLAPDSRYLGAVNYSDGTEEVGRTLVSINTNAAE
nr:cell wall-binding repeat-containing protein [Actinomycetota bacterium]